MQADFNSYMRIPKKTGSFLKNLEPKSIQTTHYSVEAKKKKLKGLIKDKE